MVRPHLHPVHAREIALRLVRAYALVVIALGMIDLIYIESRRQRIPVAAIVRIDLGEPVDAVHDEGA